MKLGVSTLGCPNWTLEEIGKRVKDCGYDGVELRGLGPDVNLTQSPAFKTPEAAAESRRILTDAGLEIVSLDSSAHFTDPDAAARAVQFDEARQYLDLAATLGAPAVRVFGGRVYEGSSPASALACVTENLTRLGEYAEGSGVRILLETHDGFSTGARVAEAVSQANHSNVGALWDLHHPFREGEPPEETLRALRPYLGLTHVKDSRPPNHYCLLGEGDIPVKAMLKLLREAEYDGYLCLEWEKRWHPEIPEPEIAFPQYAARLRQFLTELD